MEIEELILKLGGIAGAISAVAAIAWKIIKPLRDARLREQESLAEYRAGIQAAIDRLERKLTNEEEDIAFLQRYELKTAHATLMQQGWCSAEEKAAVLDLYDHYRVERHRNSLIDSYRTDIDSLPPHPPQDGE